MTLGITKHAKKQCVAATDHLSPIWKLLTNIDSRSTTNPAYQTLPYIPCPKQPQIEFKVGLKPHLGFPHENPQEESGGHTDHAHLLYPLFLLDPFCYFFSNIGATMEGI